MLTDEHQRGHCPWLVEVLLFAVQPRPFDLVDYLSEEGACGAEEHEPRHSGPLSHPIGPHDYCFAQNVTIDDC